MKKLLLALIASALIVPSASAQVRVHPYVKKDGTYLAPHYRSGSNGTTSDNYSAKGDYNPYSGQAGSKSASSTETNYGLSNIKKVTCTYLCPKHYPR